MADNCCCHSVHLVIKKYSIFVIPTKEKGLGKNSMQLCTTYIALKSFVSHELLKQHPETQQIMSQIRDDFNIPLEGQALSFQIPPGHAELPQSVATGEKKQGVYLD